MAVSSLTGLMERHATGCAYDALHAGNWQEKQEPITQTIVQPDRDIERNGI
jgi:hypothetical protein